VKELYDRLAEADAFSDELIQKRIDAVMAGRERAIAIEERIRSKHPLTWAPENRIAFLENRVQELLENNNEQVAKRRTAEAKLRAERRFDFLLGVATGLASAVLSGFLIVRT
jgi:hypothetical protein